MLQLGLAADQASPGSFFVESYSPSHRSALERYPVCVIEQTVEDGVAEGGIADDIVPVLDGDLAGEERAAAGAAVVEDLEEVLPSLA